MVHVCVGMIKKKPVKAKNVMYRSKFMAFHLKLVTSLYE